MAIAVTCHCGRSLNVREDHAGKKIRCPSCGGPLSVPRGSAAGDAAAENPEPSDDAVAPQSRKSSARAVSPPVEVPPTTASRRAGDSTSRRVRAASQESVAGSAGPAPSVPDPHPAISPGDAAPSPPAPPEHPAAIAPPEGAADDEAEAPARSRGLLGGVKASVQATVRAGKEEAVRQGRRAQIAMDLSRLRKDLEAVCAELGDKVFADPALRERVGLDDVVAQIEKLDAEIRAAEAETEELGRRLT